MSVSNVILSKSGAVGKASGTAGSPEVTEYTANWQVTAGASDTAKEVLDYFKSTSSLPWIGRGFNFSSSRQNDAVCTEIDASPIENSGGKFSVVAKFTNATNQQGGQDEEGNDSKDPRTWHDEIEVSTTQMSLPMEFAKYIGPKPANKFLQPGVEVRDPCNSAGVPFDPLPEYELDITILRITKFAAEWNDAQVNAYRGTINNDNFVIRKPQYNFTTNLFPFEGKIKQWSGVFGFEDKIKYWKHTIELHINPLTWRFLILDRGTTTIEFKKSFSGKIIGQVRKRMVDEDGVPITEPQKLDGNGGLLPDGKPPVYLLYAKYKEVPYANIQW